MPSYTAPVRDMQFLLHDVLEVSQAGIPGYEELDRDTTGAILEEAAKLAENVLAPLNPVGDAQGCRLENGVVRTPDGFKAAFDQMREGGWTALDCDPEYGGQGLPYLMSTANLDRIKDPEEALRGTSNPDPAYNRTPNNSNNR